MSYLYDLKLGLPQTNHRGLSEHLLLKFAGHFQWESIGAAAGVPLSTLRTMAGGEVYASFYYIEEIIPDRTPLESFGLDDELRFAIALRASKNIVVEGRVVFERTGGMTDTARVNAELEPSMTDHALPFIRFANIFITPEKGNSRLRVAPPAGTNLMHLPELPNDENPYHLTRSAGEGGPLGVFDEGWVAAGDYEHRYAIDVDRDTNGAGLVYFANYLAFMDTGERLALEDVTPGVNVSGRSVRHRRIAYYGNVDVTDTIIVRVTVLHHPEKPNALGLRYVIERQEDKFTICISEALKVLHP